MLSEERLDLAVEANRLGPGEPVIVITKMGKEVARGTVQEMIPNGPVHVHVEGQGSSGVAMSRMYDPGLYSFIPIEVTKEDDEAPSDSIIEPGSDPGPPIEDSSLDSRVEAKVARLGISLVEQPEPGDESGSRDKGKGPKGSASVQKDDDPRADSREAGASVEMDRLPESLRKRIVGVKGLDEAQQDKVMSEIADAALRGLKSVGVKDREVYKTVARIQEAVAPVLGLKG